MRLEPRGMHDMTGWHPLTCQQSEIALGRHFEGGDPLPGLSVASSLTDPDGDYGHPVTFTEWWFRGEPLLRSYLWGERNEERSCEHYGAVDATAALVVAE